jgi:hypothetical protein
MSLPEKFIRQPEDEADRVLLKAGWKFSGISLFSHPDDCSNAMSRTKDDALKVEMMRREAAVEELADLLWNQGARSIGG